MDHSNKDSIVESSKQSLKVALERISELHFVYIAPGQFTMGSPLYLDGVAELTHYAIAHGSAHPMDEGPRRVTQVTKGFYFLDTKITADVYVRFLNQISDAGECLTVKASSCIVVKDGKYSIKPGAGSAFVDTVTHVGASRFCDWLSGRIGRKCRLPTEAEWEYVARGKENRKYPWGDVKDGDGERTYGYAANMRVTGPTLAKSRPRNSTPNGVCDLVGPIHEWCADWYADRYAESEKVDPKGPRTGSTKVMRARELWAARRFHQPPAEIDPKSAIYGFRVIVEE